MYIPIISAVIEGVTKIWSSKVAMAEEVKKKEHDIELLKLDVEAEKVKRGEVAESDYDLKVLENAKNSYVDEILILWIIAITTLAFIPSLSEYAIEGFKALDELPIWFQLLLVGSFISKLGLRFLFSGRTILGKSVK